MSDYQELLDEVKQARVEIARTDDARTQAITEVKTAVDKSAATVTDVVAKVERISTDLAGLTAKHQEVTTTLNEVSKKVNRPAGGKGEFSAEANEAAARGLLELKHHLRNPKRDFAVPFAPTPPELEEAKTAIATLRKVLHMPHPSDLDQLSEVERKALSSFQLGTNGFLLSPEMSGQVLSCLEDKSDITGLMSNLAISGPSVRFLIDNVEIDEAAWACETSCFANNPKAKLAEGLGELELKPETLRYIVCTTSDLLEDASINIEAWMLNKVNSAFRRAVSNAIITGDGIGKPVGILKPGTGIIVCDTSDATPTNELTWQDLILLKWQVPVQYHAGARYLMNAQTFAKVLTISDAIGRPIMLASPLEPGQFLVNGSPVQIVTQMPDVAPGATPVAFGNWAATYMIVNRKAVTMQQDPYSAGFCVLYKFESRVGGGIICPQAARLLRVG